MIEYNPIYKKNGSLNGAITTAPSNSLIFDLAGKAIWAKGVKLKGTDHTYTFSHDNYITLTNTPGSDESEDIKIGVNITTLKAAIDTTYSVVTASSDGLAPMFSSGNLADTDNTDHYYLGIKGSTLKWYKNAYRQLKVGDNIVLGVTDRDPLQIISADSNLSVSWNSTNKLLVIKNEKPAIGDLTDINVSQFKVTDNTNYRLLFKGTANDNNYTGVSRFSEYLLFNPSTKLLTINGNRVITAVDVYVGATSEANATVGLVPAATSAQRTYFLRGDGTWQTLVQENTWRPIKVGTTDALGSGTDTGTLTFAAGTGITLGWDATNKKITITNSAPDQDHNTDRTGIKLGTVSGTKVTNSTLIIANSGTGLSIAGGTNLIKIGDGTNYIEVPITINHGLSTKNITINGAAYALYTSANSLPTFVAPGSYGTANYILATNSSGDGLTWVAKPTSNVTTTAIVGNSATATSQITSAQTNPYYNLLEGGLVTRSIRFVAGTGITISAATDGLITITNTSPDLNHNTDRTGIYKGTVSGTKKTDTTLIVANTSSGLIFEGGTNLFKIGDGTNYVEIPVTPSFTVTDKSASILSSLTTLATIAGTDIKAKVAVVDSSPTLTTSLKTIATIAGVEIKAKITNYNTDENVKLTPKTDNVNRPLMMINGGTSAGELTTTSIFSTGIYANANTKMITANGFVKTGYDDTSVLLAGGGAKTLTDFATSTHNHDDTYVIKKMYYVEQNSDATKFWIRDIALNYPCSVIYNGSGSEWTYWVGLNTSNKQYGHIIRCSYANSGTLQFMYKSGGTADNTTNWSGWINVAHSNNSSLSTNGTTATINILGSSADVSLTSHNHNSSYVTAVGNGSGDYINNLYYTLNGSNNYFTVNYATNATLLNYTSGVTTLSALDNDRHQANVLKCYTWNGSNASDSFGTSYPGASNGIIFDGGWSSTSYGFQLAIDDDPNWFMALRQRNGNGWAAWKRIPMGDGTGASGTWSISITGNAATATILLTARTINGVSFNGSANISIAPSLLISGNTIASQVGDQISSYITVPYATNSNLASNADTVDSIHATGFLRWKGMLNIGNHAPFQAVVDIIKDTTKLNDGGLAMYSYAGDEYTVLIGSRNDATRHGNALKWGYANRYLWLIRMISGNPLSSDWEKIYAGYADTAGDASTLGGTSKSGLLTAFSLGTDGDNTTGSITVGGTALSSSVTVPYATSASRLKYKPYSNNLNDPGTLLAGGGITRNYGSGSYWQNCPSGLSYGACVEFYAGDESLSGQFIWDINHNQATSTRNLYFRASNNLGWLNDWKRIAWASEIPTVNNASLTLQTAGTTQTTFYANDSTNRTFNVTCANIGAAVSGHNHDDIYVNVTGDTMTGALTVKLYIFGYNYNHAGGNVPAFVFDKPGSYFTGIGCHSTGDTIWFGAATISNGEASWVDSYKLKWVFNGTVTADRFYGPLTGDVTGNADTATILLTARTINGVSFNGSTNISIVPSLLISGNTIASKVGDLTSSYITVPYATNAGTAAILLTNNTSQAADTCYDENPGLRFWRYNGTSSTTGQSGGDGWILSWSWGVGSVGGQIYLDDNPSKTMCIRGRNNDANKTFTTWAKILHTDNVSPSLPINGNQIAVTVGGVTSSYITVPYASTVPWTGVTTLMQGGNEFNIPDSGYPHDSFWFNYLPRNSRSANATLISNYYFGNLGTGYANLIAAGFKKNGSSDSYVLLGGGSHKALSDFSMAHSHPYLPLAGGTMDSGAQILVGTTSKGSSNVYNGGIQLREATYSTTSCTDNMYDAPGITFHWGGWWVHKLNMHTNDIFWDNNRIWHSANDGSGSGLDADLLDGLHGSSFVKFYLSPMTAGAPADSAKSWFTGTMPSASGAIVYNVPGSEKTIIAGKSSGAYGHMLQLNYDDNYLRLLRYQAGSWKSTDWEKISAGYADSAGNADTVDGYHASSFALSGHTHDDRYVKRGGDDVTGHYTFRGRVFGYNYGNQGSNAVAFMWDKPGSYYTGMGPNGVTNQIHFGPCNADGTWVSGFNQQWDFQGNIYASGFCKNGSSDSYVLLGGGGHKALSDFTGSSDVYWKDVKDKIRYSNEFNIVPSGYNSTMWFNYRSDADTNVTVSEYIFGNGSGSASAAIKSGTVYPGSNASYDIGKTGSRWAWGYFNSGILIGSTSYTGPHTNAAGTTLASGYIEMNATDPYIDFHRSGYYTSDYSSRLIHWNNRDRLYYECYSSSYSGYVATCEGNANNLVIIGVFDLYKTNDTTLTWSISTICGPCSFSLQKDNSIYDVSFKSRTSSAQSWTISGNVLRVYVNGPSSNTYAWKSTPYAVSCDARVMTRWINNQPVVTNCLHGDWQGSSVECLCTNLSNGSSLYYYSYSPGRYIYITGSRPWGYDDGSNGMGMDMMRMTGNLSYQRIRFTVFGYLS